MEAYDTVPPDDPFAASKGMLAALADELAGPAAAGMTACELEELLDERGREVPPHRRYPVVRSGTSPASHVRDNPEAVIPGQIPALPAEITNRTAAFAGLRRHLTYWVVPGT